MNLKGTRLYICHGEIVHPPGMDDLPDYDPNLLSDPQWPCGKHKRVLIFSSYMVRVIPDNRPHVSWGNGAHMMLSSPSSSSIITVQSYTL